MIDASYWVIVYGLYYQPIQEIREFFMFQNSRTTSNTSKQLMITVLKILISIVLAYCFSYLTNLILNLSLVDFDKNLYLDMIEHGTEAHDFAFFLVFILYIILIFALNNLLFSTVLIVIGVASLLIANTVKMSMLSDPVFPSDFIYIGNFVSLLKLIDNQKLLIVILGLIFISIMLIGTWFLNQRYPYFSIVNHRYLKYLVPIVFIVILLGFSKFVSGYNREYSRIYQYSVANNLYPEYQSWLQLDNYKTYGFVNGLILNAPGINIDTPEHYSQERVIQVVEKYQQCADKINVTRKNEDFSNVNLITILSESLSDPSIFNGIETESPFSYITDESDKVKTGYIFSPVYGGGTPNTEYEIITGMSSGALNNTVSTAFQSFVAGNSDLPSLFKINNELPRDTIAIHSYSSSFFKRSQSYESLGVDTQIFEKNMIHKEKLYGTGQYISDRSSYDELLSYYKSSENPLNMHLVTMQNHVVYLDTYPSYSFEVKSDSIESQDVLNQFKYYMEGLKETDIATKQLIEELNDEEKPYILFFYGDHLPGIYNELLDINDYAMRFKTNYFVSTNIDNYESSLLDKDIISLNNVQNIFMEIADVKISAYQALIMAINEEFDTISRTGIYINGNPSPTSYEELNDFQKELFDDYMIVQYDLVEGYGYASDFVYYDKLR